MDFAEKLLQASRRNNSLLCLGLDPDPELMPETGIIEFNRAIIDSTSDLVCAYKPNLAFYEALGDAGLAALQETLKHVPDSIPVIGDAKRGDVGHTARAYARALFEVLGFDAVTVNPYLGHDCVEPFALYADKAVFVLCRTSNPGAGDFQDARCSIGQGSQQQPLYLLVASKAKEWNKRNNIGLVVGATYPQELKEIRRICPQMHLLIPGIGAQGGDLEQAVLHGTDGRGQKAIFSSSRQILYASRGSDFARAARQAADQLRQQINSFL